MAHEGYKHIGSLDDKVIEECAELIQAIMKARRFGLWNHHPKTPDIPNCKSILLEINDVRRTCDEYEQSLRKEFSD